MNGIYQLKPKLRAKLGHPQFQLASEATLQVPNPMSRRLIRGRLRRLIVPKDAYSIAWVGSTADDQNTKIPCIMPIAQPTATWASGALSTCSRELFDNTCTLDQCLQALSNTASLEFYRPCILGTQSLRRHLLHVLYISLVQGKSRISVSREIKRKQKRK